MEQEVAVGTGGAGGSEPGGLDGDTAVNDDGGHIVGAGESSRAEVDRVSGPVEEAEAVAVVEGLVGDAAGGAGNVFEGDGQGAVAGRQREAVVADGGEAGASVGVGQVPVCRVFIAGLEVLVEGEDDAVKVAVAIGVISVSRNRELRRQAVNGEDVTGNADDIHGLTEDEVAVVDLSEELVAAIGKLPVVGVLVGLHDDEEVVDAIDGLVVDPVIESGGKGNAVLVAVAGPGRDFSQGDEPVDEGVEDAIAIGITVEEDAGIDVGVAGAVTESAQVRGRVELVHIPEAHGEPVEGDVGSPAIGDIEADHGRHGVAGVVERGRYGRLIAADLAGTVSDPEAPTEGGGVVGVVEGPEDVLAGFVTQRHGPAFLESNVVGGDEAAEGSAMGHLDLGLRQGGLVAIPGVVAVVDDLVAAAVEDEGGDDPGEQRFGHDLIAVAEVATTVGIVVVEATKAWDAGAGGDGHGLGTDQRRVLGDQ